jgi:hypothetical protein
VLTVNAKTDSKLLNSAVKALLEYRKSLYDPSGRKRRSMDPAVTDEYFIDIVSGLNITPKNLSKATGIPVDKIETVYREKSFTSISELSPPSVNRLRSIMSGIAMTYVVEAEHDTRLTHLIGALHKNGGIIISYEAISMFAGVDVNVAERFMDNPSSISDTEKYKLSISASRLHLYFFMEPYASDKVSAANIVDTRVS